MAKLISKTYGEALFTLAMEEHSLDLVSEEIQVIVEALKENPDLFRLLNHPKISKEEKSAVVENIFKDKVSDTVVGFMMIIVAKDRYNDMLEIFSYFLDKVKEYKKIGVAYVTSAIPLSEEQKKAVYNRLLETTEYKQFEMNYQVDQSLIGGLVIRVGDRIVDSSIRSKLNTMAKSLSQVQL